jgi:superfamily II RNA helicase
MVKICNTSYPKSSEEIFIDHFSKYSYELHDFQKYAIQAIVEGNHVLVTAPTGSGKTLPGEFALDFFANKGKKTIYCSPIKALSNQKFYDFTNKYPNISIGIITGDIKCNPDAQVIIMTTEILLNKLYKQDNNSSTSFEMDIENELACIVFDEVHMINDPFRGHIWEQSIILLPPQVQMVMLSATLDKPEKFASWCENRDNSTKRVYIASKKGRAVPLKHYYFLTTTSSIFKLIKDKTQQSEINAVINKPFEILNAKGEFNEIQYHNINNTLKLFESKKVFIKRQHVLNQVTKYLVENDMLPALCFVLSRKQLEICAKEITTILLEDDSKIPYLIKCECDKILRKLPNFNEYLDLPEYIELTGWLEKGVGIHHAGMMPVLREMVELLFSKGYIKVLFCTETLSIGINMPVKTTIFTDVKKFDGKENRLLYSHEYTQMAGRAGRLGLDKVGHVIHLNNLFRNVSLLDYKTFMNGKPQTLVSKFKISYNMLLNLISIGETNFTSFSQKSMIQGDVDAEIKEVYYKLTKLAAETENYNSIISSLRSPNSAILDYIELSKKVVVSYNKQKRECEKKINFLKEEYIYIDSDVKTFNKYLSKVHELEDLEKEIKDLEKTVENNVNLILNILIKNGFISKDNEEKYYLTNKGLIAGHLREVHCLAFASLMEKPVFKQLSVKQLVCLLSCFTNINVPGELKSLFPQTKDETLKNIILELNKDLQDYLMVEIQLLINTGSDYNIHYDLIELVLQWLDCENISECKLFLLNLEIEKGIFLGEFVKALLKINNISSEMEKIAEVTGDIEFLSKLREIPTMTLKYVVTNQSLYV